MAFGENMAFGEYINLGENTVLFGENMICGGTYFW